MTTRGLRNNNPGNIRLSQQHWNGEVFGQTGQDKDFCTFSQMAYGVRAMGIIFLNYQRRYKLLTPRQLINRWAPTNENDTDAYVSDVCAKTGLGINAPIRLDRTPIMRLFLYAVILHENSGWETDIDQSQFFNGVGMALKSGGLA